MRTRQTFKKIDSQFKSRFFEQYNNYKQAFSSAYFIRCLTYILFYFISIFILLTCRKATEALIHRVGNYPDLLPEIPRYCCPLVI